MHIKVGRDSSAGIAEGQVLPRFTGVGGACSGKINHGVAGLNGGNRIDNPSLHRVGGPSVIVDVDDVEGISFSCCHGS